MRWKKNKVSTLALKRQIQVIRFGLRRGTLMKWMDEQGSDSEGGAFRLEVLSVQSRLADIFSFSLAIQSIDEDPLLQTRKRKERDEDEVTSQSSPLPPAPTPKTNLENLETHAAATAVNISKILGGDAWKTQSIGKLGLIQTKGAVALQSLQRAIKTSLQLPQVANSEAGSLQFGFGGSFDQSLSSTYQ